MLNVGLTGNIAAGKSTVTELLRRWGAYVIDADRLTREVQQPGSDVLDAIRERFGTETIRADGTLDRSALRNLVFGDEDALASLNAIVHPAVRRKRAELMEAAEDTGTPLVINDIPLLFEVLDPADFDCIVLIDAPRKQRIARICRTRGLGAAEAEKVVESQSDPEEKRRLSDFVIDNAGTLEELEGRAREVWEKLRSLAG